MKRNLVYRPEALADLEEARAYTLRTWGMDQAKRYVAGLVADIKALRLSGARYPLYDPIWPGLRRKRSAMHHIYYQVADERVEIVRIVHVQSDPGRHLKVGEWRE